MNRKLLGSAILSVAILFSIRSWAGEKYVLTTDPAKVNDVCGRHGLTPVATGWSDGNSGVYLVSSSSTVDVSSLAQDTDVSTVEPDQSITIPEGSGNTEAALQQSTTGILDQINGATVVSYYGAHVPSFYVQQPATEIIRLTDARSLTGLTGTATVAVIDTGVDQLHPALAGVLVPGYDFTRNISGGSELWDVPLSTLIRLAQSTTGILDGGQVVEINGSTALLAQSTTGILDGDPDWGHGTMTAGLVHLVAPTAKIMPLKAFQSDGTSDSFNIIRAIYYAVDHGANVISMSFEMLQPSPGMQNAIEYAIGKGVTVVAASGNDGKRIDVYPAALNDVIGVGSTNDSDQRSTFSNYDSNGVFVAAPGEGVITTFPLGNYAAGWGTSFSAPLVAGEAALILQARPAYNSNDVGNAISRAHQVSQMGHGRVDLLQALQDFAPNIKH